jgi:hypothetical protein
MRLSGPLRGTLFSAGAVTVSLAVFLPWLGLDYRLEPRKSALNDYWKARVPDMIYGRAYRPFVRRTLVPSTVRLVRTSLSRSTLGALRAAASRKPFSLPEKLGTLGWEPAYMVEYVLAMPLLFALLVAFPFSLRWLFDGLYEAPWASVIASLLATAMLPALFFDRGTHYLYDFATLTLTTLALGCIRRERFAAFYAVFLLGCVNKETMVLATLAFGLVESQRMPLARLARHVLFQLLLFAAVGGILAHVFRHNRGEWLEWHLVKNIRLLEVPPSLSSALFLASGAVLILARFGRRLSFLRYTAVIFLPLLVSYLFSGIYGEVRAFYEAYPVLFLLAFQNACEALGFPLRERPPRSAVETPPGALVEGAAVVAEPAAAAE